MVQFKSSIYMLHHSHGSARAYCTAGLVSTTFGSNICKFCRPHTDPLRYRRKFAPFFLVIGGALLGYFLTRVTSPLVARIFSLTPTTQYFATLAVGAARHQSQVDKGWVEAGSASVSSLTATLLTHFTPTLGMGLCITLLVFLI